MTSPRTIECALPACRRRSRRPAQQTPAAVGPGRVPRVSRLLALALRLDRLVRAGEIADYATLARLGHVSRARVSQILRLLLLAPDIQETLLFLPSTEHGRDPIRLRQLQPLTALPRPPSRWPNRNAAALLRGASCPTHTLPWSRSSVPERPGAWSGTPP